VNYGVLGTGTVGQTLSAKLDELGHDVMIGTRDVEQTLARTGPDRLGNPPFSAWHEQHPGVKPGSFAETAAHGEIVINATNGQATLSVLEAAGADNLNGKILIDVANPLVFSQGKMTLSVCNDDSLAEQIQRAHPKARVVKTLNTMTARVMVNPAMLAEDHVVFVSGNDAEAKASVTALLKDGFGWKSVVDLGDITTARGVEMFLPLWVQLMGVMGTPLFNLKIVQR
jgi:predicted dinucleotide-binding enzyme